MSLADLVPIATINAKPDKPTRKRRAAKKWQAANRTHLRAYRRAYYLRTNA